MSIATFNMSPRASSSSYIARHFRWPTAATVERVLSVSLSGSSLRNWTARDICVSCQRIGARTTTAFCGLSRAHVESKANIADGPLRGGFTEKLKLSAMSHLWVLILFHLYFETCPPLLIISCPDRERVRCLLVYSSDPVVGVECVAVRPSGPVLGLCGSPLLQGTVLLLVTRMYLGQEL